VSGISTDTRTLLSAGAGGGGGLFAALKGKRFDGHAYLDEAAARGAAALLVEEGALATLFGRSRPTLAKGSAATIPTVSVKDTQQALLALAAHYRKKFSPRLAAVTGSNGKTTTKDLLGRALAEGGETVFSERSFNNFVGVPLTLLRIDSSTRFAVVEVGTNAPGEIAALTGAVRPDFGIVTNIGPSHLEGLGTIEGVAAEKADLVRGIAEGGTALLNRDEPFFDLLEKAALERSPALQVRTFAICADADYRAEKIEPFGRPDASTDSLAAGVAFEVNGTPIRLPLLGHHNVYNGLAAFACAVEMGLAPGQAAAALARFEGAPMRLEARRAGGVLVVNDAYNANPASMTAALAVFAGLETAGRRIVILGDMLELGESSAELHRRVGKELGRDAFALIALVGAQAAEIAAGAASKGVGPERIHIFADTGEALEGIPPLVRKGDAVLVKGSRELELEKVVDALAARFAEGGSRENPRHGMGTLS
jgi:UDP-N-acetylmuramoyl-tripeptide--D-alanyl-D-alanine ligase